MMVRNCFFGEDGHDQQAESKLTKEAFRSETGFNEHYYLDKLSKNGCDVKILVETPYMSEGYKQLNTKLGNDVKIEYALLGVSDYETFLSEGYLIITLIDLWYLDMIIHYPHYVIIDSYDQNNFYVIDPKYGMRVKFSKHRFQETLDSVKNRLGYSSLIFAVRKRPEQQLY
jgi:hypothetical protein